MEAPPIASPPRPISDVEQLASETGDVEYWPVEATGRFLHEGESHFFATWKGRSGFFIYTQGFVIIFSHVILPPAGLLRKQTARKSLLKQVRS